MKTYIDKVRDEEFYAKFGGVRSFLGIALTALQLVSACTASAGLYHFMNLHWEPGRWMLAGLIALLLELLVRKAGYPTLLFAAEKISGIRAYNIREQARQVETGIIVLAGFVFLSCFLTTATFTISGSMHIARALRDPGPAPDRDSIRQAVAMDITAKPKYASDPRRAELADLSRGIPEKEKTITDKDREAKADWAKKSRTYWPSMAHTWDNLGGRDKQARELANMKQRRAELTDALSGLNAEMDQEINAATSEKYEAAMTAYAARVDRSEGSGAKGLLVGIVCQFLVIPVYLIIMMLDLGTGQIKRRVPMALDHVNVVAEAWNVFWHRAKMRCVNRIADWSARPLLAPDRPGGEVPEGMRAIEVEDGKSFQIRYLLSEEMSAPGNLLNGNYRPAPPLSGAKPAYAIGMQFSQGSENGENGTANGNESGENVTENVTEQDEPVAVAENGREHAVEQGAEKLHNPRHASVMQFSDDPQQDAFDIEGAFDQLNNRIAGIENAAKPAYAGVTQFQDVGDEGEPFFAYRKADGSVENMDASRLENLGGSTYYARAVRTAGKLIDARARLQDRDDKVRQKAERDTARLEQTLSRQVIGNAATRNCVAFFRDAGMEAFGKDFLPVWQEKHGGRGEAGRMIQQLLK